MTRALLLLVALVLLILPLACGSSGEECDTCSSDADCNAGLVCVGFEDENGNPVGQRCGSGVGGTTCRVR